jgi:ribonuclease J
MNCMVLEQGQDVLVIDCGIRFPHDDLGLDVVHPDFSWLLSQRDRVRGVFLTHGHEDHIGALPFLLGEIDVPVWGPPHALALARDRLADRGFDPADVSFRAAIAGQAYRVGDFEIEPIRVAHSIVEASALRIRTEVGTILHSGDFNFDPAPPDGEPTDERRLAELGELGVGLLLSDSTNVDVPEKKGSEVEVGRALGDVVRAARRSVFIALFASNVQRLILLGKIAEETGRKICLLGRSLRHHVDVATEIGRLRWPSDLIVSPERARKMPRSSILALVGGTQGERHSALARLAIGAHPDFSIEEGDTVVLSSRVIPGNERAVASMQDDLLRLGVDVHSRITLELVHTSGHATRAEQRRMIDLVQPACFVPIHGTLHHLRRHADLARTSGVGDVLVAENGDAVVFDGRSVRLEGRVPSGIVSIGLGGLPVSPATLKERTELGRAGTATLSLSLDRELRIVTPPVLTARGVSGVSEGGAELRGVVLEIGRYLDRVPKQRRMDDDLSEALRRLVRRELERISGTKPHVDVHLFFLD